jgi:hypothetical protein
MHTLRLLFILLSLSSVNLSRPLDVTPVREALPPHPNSPDIPIPIEDALEAGHGDNLRTLLEARLSANRMLNKMKEVIQNPASPGHSEIIQAAFGPRHDNQQIIHTIQRMRDVDMRARVHPLVPSLSPAVTRFVVQPIGHARVADSVVLGPSFFGLHPAAGGGTLIREAARYTAGAGVHCRQHRANGQCHILPEGAALLQDRTWRRTPAFLHEDLEFPASIPAECAMNADWMRITQNSRNMHQCADAYRVFGNLCNYAIQRRDVHILKRALLEGDKQASPRSDAASCPPQRIKKNTVPNTS